MISNEIFLLSYQHDLIEKKLYLSGIMKTMTIKPHTQIVEAKDITYRFDIEGNITPYLEITPRIAIGEDKVLSKFPLLSFSPEADIAPGDKLLISPPRDEEDTCRIRILEQSDYRRRAIQRTTCPVCGERLFPTSRRHGIGRCISRSCPAQIATNTQIFLASLGVQLTTSLRSIMKELLAQGALYNPLSIFKICLADIETFYLTDLELQMFQRTLNRVWVHVDVGMLLDGLHIPKLTNTDTRTIAHYWADKHYTLANMDKLFDIDTLKKDLPEIDWTGWEEYLTLTMNRNLIMEMAYFFGR